MSKDHYTNVFIYAVKMGHALFSAMSQIVRSYRLRAGMSSLSMCHFFSIRIVVLFLHVSPCFGLERHTELFECLIFWDASTSEIEAHCDGANVTVTHFSARNLTFLEGNNPVYGSVSFESTLHEETSLGSEVKGLLRVLKDSESILELGSFPPRLQRFLSDPTTCAKKVKVGVLNAFSIAEDDVIHPAFAGMQPRFVNVVDCDDAKIVFHSYRFADIQYAEVDYRVRGLVVFSVFSFVSRESSGH